MNEVETVDVTPVTPRQALDKCRIEILEGGKWKNFAAEDGPFPVAACLELFMGWGWVNSPVRIITDAGKLVCGNAAYHKKFSW